MIIIRKYLKRVVFIVLDIVYLIYARMLFLISRTVTISEEEALNRLKNYGYKFKPLWKDPLLPLKNNSLDISFIIPIYNTEKFLPKCLDSILTQETTYCYEVICIDDGSTDNCSEILKQYQNKYAKKIKVITQNNSGLSISRNKALLEACGEYIGFIDSDDYVSSDYITCMMERAKQTKAEIVQSRFITINTNGNILSKNNLGNIITTDDFQSVFDRIKGYMGGKIFLKSLFKEIRCPEKFIYEDMITRMCLVHLCHRIAFTQKASYYYLQHPMSITKTAKKSNIKPIDQYWLARSLCDFALDKLDIEKSRIYCILLKEWSSLMYDRCANLPKEVRQAIFLLCRNYLNKRFEVVDAPSQIHFRLIRKAFKAYNYPAYCIISKSLYYRYKAQ